MNFNFKVLSKGNLYGRLLLFLLLMEITIILSSESAYLFGEPLLGPKYGGVLVSVFFLLYLFYAIRLLPMLGVGKSVIKLFIVYAILGILCALYIANPFVDLLTYGQKQFSFTLMHIASIAVHIYFMSLILRDIFQSEETHSDHIWGGIVAYFQVNFLFSEIYEIITLQQPGLLGQVYEIGWPNYIQCLMFSLNSIAGVDLIYPDAHPLMLKIGNLENVIGNLFLVVILGRLLSHPLKK